MKIRDIIPIAYLLGVVLSCGCSSADKTHGFQGTVREVTRKFNGKIGGLLGNGQVAAVNSECRGFGRGPTDNGKYWVYFDLTPSGPTNPPTEFQIYFIFPALATGMVLVTNTDSRVVDVWFFKNDAGSSNRVYVAQNNEEQLHRRGGEKMNGRIAIKWNGDADFVIGADLTLLGDRSTWARGEFVGNTMTRLNPILYEWPAILLFQESK